ncbi:23S rRNA (pseudouridine(1915)-N(3))-methyltransferase RlmH [Cupriavidus sp. USMAA2-4]|uniref:Ribosomal RNA large subunit methyltransferase H n=1 Tax=Cupriavidus malaysiensis TaxID=367825 RepID=A0ABN4TN39_9BURK|nr:MULTISPECIES: 23S rRNA (pseudouridine(1915)-N(3))-methyltransferase RlmH [Cupriavidus]AOY91343.1 23S rRNA (pseudouridine(1915)-N(3))-methyltransferase RlmH [Cupriavidus sp. USMAA2-4]AOY99087.1 23S rRNA (pseudouridine(1915)-N(3))-methyltransferase RlmH [Cupriavidus sp. USMAHM13]AOZ05509.1 23S rRNA (pseudouridine(1915)-N(3))-methyltransferase RlmH [Cupriavidus malaysiensis]
MQLVIVAVGHKMPGWIETGFAEYAKRMPPELRIELREVKPETRSSSNNAATVMQREAARIDAVLAGLPRQCRIVALDERGRDLSTVQLAEQLTGWQREGGDVAFLIGGADGLDPALKARAQMLLRLSSLTLPHGMVRVLLAEQLYRAWSVTQNHPYHRA